MEKHAAYCGTSNIIDDMASAAKSLIAHSDVDKVWLITDGAKPSEKLPDIVEVLDVSNQTYFKADGPNMTSKFTWLAMIRIALCHVLPEDVHTVLSLDFDTFAIRDASSVWDIDVNNTYFAATPEWHRTKNGLMYTNHGVVLYNLDNMRDGKADECIWLLNNRKYTWLDQDAGNYLCQGRITEMPSKYNDNYWTTKGECRDTVIIHYAGEAYDKWHGKSTPRKYQRMSWDAAMDAHKKVITGVR